MLFQVEHVDTKLEYVNSVLQYFLSRALRASRYNKNSFFPNDFLTVINCNRNKSNEKFSALFKEIKTLNKTQKVFLYRAFRNNAKVELLCKDKNIQLLQTSELPEDCKKALRELGSYLYSSVLKNKKYTGLASVSETKADHYSRFIKLNGEVCCFCGMRPYTDPVSYTHLTLPTKA